MLADSSASMILRVRMSRMPFISEDLKKQTQAVLKRTGLDNIRVHYINGCSSSRIFTPPKEKQSCPGPCDTCGSSTRTNLCLTKTVYTKSNAHTATRFISVKQVELSDPE